MPVAPNLLARNFTPAAPDRVWKGESPSSRPANVGCYLAIVLDLFNREIVGWLTKPTRMTADIVTDALTRPGCAASRTWASSSTATAAARP